MRVLTKTSLSKEVSRQLLGMIQSGELIAGSKIPSETELCQALDVSRTAVREGIKALEGINVLATMQGKGTFVQEDPDIMVQEDALHMNLFRETIEDIYEVRSILDLGLAKNAALKADEMDIVQMELALVNTEKSICSPIDKEGALKGDEDFHRALCRATHNRILEKLAWPIINHIVLNRSKNARFSLLLMKQAVEEHGKILAAIKKQDVAEAMDKMKEHLVNSFENFYMV